VVAGRNIAVQANVRPSVIEKYLPMSDELHRYMVEHSSPRDDALLAVERETEELGGIAVMQMAPEQGALFTVLIGAMNARLAVEVGTFTGYGAICIARGLAPGGRLICCELDPDRAAMARRALDRAGLGDVADVRVGPALETLRSLPLDAGVDFAFVDADKPAYSDYFEELLPRMRIGGIIALDNVLQGGDVVDPAADDESTVAMRALNDRLARDSRVEVAMVAVADGITFARKL
jgi:caffeoyl-CoA O-methyltransferase